MACYNNTMNWDERKDFPMWGSDNIQRERKFNVKKFNKAKIVVRVERRYKKTSYLLLFQFFYPLKKSKLYIQDGYFLIDFHTYNKFKKWKFYERKSFYWMERDLNRLFSWCFVVVYLLCQNSNWRFFR